MKEQYGHVKAFDTITENRAPEPMGFITHSNDVQVLGVKTVAMLGNVVIAASK